jgi:hypothetical protein
MKKLLLALAASAALAGCAVTPQQLSAVANVITSGKALVRNVNNAMPKACAAVAAVAGDVGNGVAAAGAANPGNAQVQSVVQKVNERVPLASADCALVQTLLASLQ